VSEQSEMNRLCRCEHRMGDHLVAVGPCRFDTCPCERFLTGLGSAKKQP
jgi:hypothetical protein